MRITHSYWTRPLRIKCFNLEYERLSGNIWYFALSLAYLKKLNVTTVLHTDTLGKALLGHLPYDEIHLTLDDIPEEVHPRFWAAGKFYALEKEPLDSIHIDGDVFIKNPKVLEILDTPNMVVQSEEDKKCFRDYYLTYLYDNISSELLEKFNFDISYIGGYNTGVLKFHNKELKDSFLERYFYISKRVSKLQEEILTKNDMAIPDLILEQMSICQLANQMGIKPTLVLDGPDISKTAAELGYQHVITSCKFNHMNKVKEILKKINPEIYNKTYKLCQNI